MDISEIISISGMGGLFKIVAQTKNGFIVESLIDKKRIPAYASYKISALDEISVFTEGEDLPLADVFKKIYEKENGKAAIDSKSSNDELKNYFESAIPDYDKDRVYTSDIKKIISWYNLLVKEGLLKPEEDKDEKEGAEEKTEKKTVTKTATEEKKKPSAAPKNTTKATKPNKNIAKAKTQTVRKTGA